MQNSGFQKIKSAIWSRWVGSFQALEKIKSAFLFLIIYMKKLLSSDWLR